MDPSIDAGSLGSRRTGSRDGRIHQPCRKVGLVLLMLVLTAPAAAAHGAGSWRCGARLIGTGQSVGDVYDRCGEPTERASSTELVTIRLSCDVAVTRAVAVENWTYDLGPQQFVRYLTFRDGTLVEIDEGSYGY